MSTIMHSVLHVFALSGGKDSTALALRWRELHPEDPLTAVCTPTGDEPPELIRHWLKVGALLGTNILPITSGKSLNGLIERQRALPNHRARWCTRMLKIEPYGKWLASQTQRYDRVISHVGIRADEPDREAGDYSDIPGVEMVFDMREWGWTIEHVLSYLRALDVTIPKRTDCLRCFFQRLIEWYEFWRDYPEQWRSAEAQEELTGHTFRSPQRDTWPASLRGLRERFERGDIPKDTRKDPINALKCRVCRL